MKFSKKLEGGLIATIGFILSPLSWWNDFVVNFPLSYIIALPFGLINEGLFLPSFIAAYWLTNILGLLLLHNGSKKILKPEEEVKSFRKDLKSTLFWSSIYTVVIMILILSGILSFPKEFLDHL